MCWCDVILTSSLARNVKNHGNVPCNAKKKEIEVVGERETLKLIKMKGRKETRGRSRRKTTTKTKKKKGERGKKREERERE